MSRLRRMVPRSVVRRLRNMQHRAQVRAVLRAHRRAAPVPAARQLDIALVIPVWNDADRLARLLAQVQQLGCFSQIIVVDDGSDIPVTAENVTLIRHNTPLGGGLARNAGLAKVTCSHVLFFDSDDLLTAELPPLLADLTEVGSFDFCLFKHADSRISNLGHWGQPDADEAFWQEASLSVGALQEAPAATWPLLVQTANYPWNKVYRTDFLTKHSIGCAATLVHQDIPLHWLGFLAANRILVSDRICAWHEVTGEGRRLTNRKGAERLAVFDALAPVTTRVDTLGDPAFQIALVTFVLELMIWVTDHLDPAFHTDLNSALRDWLTGPVAPWHANIAFRNPTLAARIKTHL